MDPKTLKALKASIAHWKRMAKHGIKGKDQPFAEECALCVSFNLGRHSYAQCYGCPVFQATDQRECRLTPYFEAREEFEFAKDTGEDSLFKAAARKEVQFLESLLPTAKKPRK